MIKVLVEAIFAFILFTFIPSIIMMIFGFVGPMLFLIGLMFVEYFLVLKV